MKGLLLSAFIVISFIAFAFIQKLGIQLPFSDNEDEKPSVSTPQTTNTAPTNTPQPSQAVTSYKDGEYIGDIVNANYGNIQVKAIISGGKITDIQFLDYPKDRTTSQKINDKAMPVLISEAIKAQNSDVDVITGATFTSAAFKVSLRSALKKAV